MQRLLLAGAVMIALTTCTRFSEPRAHHDFKSHHPNVVGSTHATQHPLSKVDPSAHYRRNGPTLSVRTQAGWIDFHDKVAASYDDTESYDYQYLQYDAKAQLHLLYWAGHEMQGFVAVHDQSGAYAYIDHFPVLSPDKKRIVVANSDYESQFTPNSVEVLLIDQGLMRQEFRLDIDPAEWTPLNARWQTPTLIRIEGLCTPQRELESPPRVSPACTAHLSQSADSDKWVFSLEENPSPSTATK